MRGRTCLDCGAPAEWALLDEHGTVEGYVCTPCDYKRRRRRMGWRRRTSVWLTHRFGL